MSLEKQRYAFASHWLEGNGAHHEDQYELPEYLAGHVPGISNLSASEKLAVGGHAFTIMSDIFRRNMGKQANTDKHYQKDSPIYKEIGQQALNRHNHLMATEPEYRSLMSKGRYDDDSETGVSPFTYDGVNGYHPLVKKFITSPEKEEAK